MATHALTAEQTLAMAQALLAAGRLGEAEALLRAALKLKPGSAEAHNDLGIALARQGRYAEAIPEYEAALALKPGWAAALGNLGNALSDSGRKDEAIARFEEALAADPNRAETHNDLGVVLASLKREADAVPRFKRALALAPDFAAAAGNLANALSALERYDDAIAIFGKVLARDPNQVSALCALGYALQRADRPQESLAAYERALALAPENPESHRGRAFALQTLGRIAEGRAEFERAVALAPDRPAFHRALADAKRFHTDDAQIAQMEALEKTALSESQRIEIDFALGKAYQDLGRNEEALRRFIEGNALKRKNEDYDEAATLTMLRHIAEVFGADLLARNAGSGDPSDVPVFILGMPRSGSTLIEQILASHPHVFGAGELHVLSDIAKSFRGADAHAYFPEAAKTLSPAQWRAFGAEYVARLRSRAPGAARITDKMPANFRFIGLIRLALPNARIIHTMRDPVDTCLSCFSKLFGGSQPYAYDLAELGRYYAAYERLMAHWRAVLPQGAMLEVQYETLVGDFEAEARRIVGYCGLAWDDKCLAFDKTDRPVRTASMTQVRQPIFGDSIGRWKSYESLLEPLLQSISKGKI